MRPCRAKSRRRRAQLVARNRKLNAVIFGSLPAGCGRPLGDGPADWMASSSPAICGASEIIRGRRLEQVQDGPYCGAPCSMGAAWMVRGPRRLGPRIYSPAFQPALPPCACNPAGYARGGSPEPPIGLQECAHPIDCLLTLTAHCPCPCLTFAPSLPAGHSRTASRRLRKRCNSAQWIRSGK
ncbi:hypothetical protein CENSYa_0839 [Cenarchaeum symbiosum A]|uniref:Uncharacterized protein n=1 Tax=Cenarchaeum symbiosum (strain A) TaxID=414004 RepID=A0RVV5_CENSY|nr:hypothetical protein CENSYa_0839 [Cenarchaeum symbiosum A]